MQKDDQDGGKRETTATNIQWDTEQEDGFRPAARALHLPRRATLNLTPEEAQEGGAADALSEQYGYAVLSLCLPGMVN